MVGIYAAGMGVCLDSGKAMGVADGVGDGGVRQSVEEQEQEKESIEDFIRWIEKVSQGYDELPPVDTFVT